MQIAAISLCLLTTAALCSSQVALNITTDYDVKVIPRDENMGAISSLTFLICVVKPDLDVSMFETQWLHPSGVPVNSITAQNSAKFITNEGGVGNGNIGTLLVIMLLRYLDAGNYTCQARRESTDPWVSDVIQLQTTFSLQTEASTVSVLDNATEVELTCEMREFLRPDGAFQWFKDGELIDTASARYSLTFRNSEVENTSQSGLRVLVPGRVSTLSILSPRQSDSGNYTCVVETTGVDIRLQVEGAEVFEAVRTTRHGLVPVNGSERFGGCPLICRREAGGIDVCDCQPNDLTNFLVDGVIPDIGNPNGSNTWASQLFTVERTVQNTAVIGFDFEVPERPTTVVISMFNCPPWDIYADTITVYSSILFPTLNLDTFATPVGSISPGCTSCDSLLTFHVPVDVSSGLSAYYVEFSDTSPDSTSREWVHLAEISFTNDPPPPTPDPNCTIMPTPTSSATSSATAMSVFPTPQMTTDATTGPTPLPVTAVVIAAVVPTVALGLLILVILVALVAFLKQRNRPANDASNEPRTEAEYEEIADLPPHSSRGREDVEMKENMAYAVGRT